VPGEGGHVDEATRALWERGRTRYPELALDLGAFAAYLRTRLAGELADSQRELAEDLFLVSACLAGVPGAAEQFSREHRASLATYVAPVVRGAHAIEELVDVLVAEILVGADGEAPRLATYGGRGPLRAWLRMLAVRRSLNEARDVARHARLEHRLFTEAVEATAAPEVTFMKARYGPDFKAAFRDAMGALAAPERALLRLHYGQELPLTELGAMHGWSKATASRRVAAARTAMLEAACALLRQRLRLDAEELESLFRVVRSQLDVGLSDLLRPNASAR